MLTKIWRGLKRQAKGDCPPAAPSSLGTDTHSQAAVTHITPFIPTVSHHAASEVLLTVTSGISSPVPIPNHDSPTTTAANTDVWAEAYEKFAKREPQLANDYNTLLVAIYGKDTVLLDDSLNPAQVNSIVEQLQVKREEKQWHFSFRGKTVNVRAQAEKLAKVLVWCDGIVKTALTVQPYAALAWSGVSILLPLLTNGTAQHEALLSGFDSISRVQVYWKVYQDASPEEVCLNSNVVVWAGFVELYSHIFEYQARAICHLSGTQLSRGWQKVAGWNDWEGKSSHVDELSEHCKECINVTQAKATHKKAAEQLEQIYESRAALEQIYKILEEERKQRLNDLQDQRERELLADLAADHETYKNFNPPKVPGTCEWFLEDAGLKRWLASKESSFLWTSAGPGCGKSVLSRSLIDERQLSTSPATSSICYFFFKDGDDRRERWSNALSAILHQLLMQDLTGNFIGHALIRYRNHGKALATNSSELWNILLDCATTPNAGEIICVLDALDECRKEERDIIIGKLQTFFSSDGPASHRTCRLKFFITSRPYDTIERPIGRFPDSSYLRIDGDDHSSAISKDIDRVIDVMVPKLMDHITEENRQRISERLKSMKNRTYLWLRLTFYMIQQNPSDYDKHSDVETLLNSVPDELSSAYERILDQTESRYTRVLLQLMLAATRPLSIDEANYALTLAVKNPPFKSHSTLEENIWKVDFKSVAKNYCGLLVDVHDSQLSFIHQTVREFLTKPQQESGKWRWRGCFSLPECHKIMSRSCIGYMSLREITELRHPVYMSSERSTYPFFSYAAQYWPFHYREQNQDEDDYWLREARNLCRRPLALDGSLVLDKSLAILRPPSNRFRKTERQLTGLALAAFLGLERVVRVIINEDTSLVDAPCKGCTALQAGAIAGPIVAALLKGNTTVVDMFFQLRGEEIITEDIVIAAARARKHGEIAMALILEKRGKEVKITHDALLAVAANTYCGDEIMALLFEKRGEEIKITHNVLVAAARNGRHGEKMLALILDKYDKEDKEAGIDSEVEVTRDDIVKAWEGRSTIPDSAWTNPRPIQERWAPYGLKSWKIAQYANPEAPYVVHAWLEWESKEHYDKGVSSADGATVFADVPKFSDKTPVLLAGEQVASASW
ncbi:hypothetical protein NUW58_g3282 [Xylaria curta]|uniref:Uncharacterized protein n=1 Tax=Xylaria curta TaxID=42375 RepID=A0ACC1PE15_9PEZI|nr:hypothetical protein NUW58_g3282 [Xylaria curta]